MELFAEALSVVGAMVLSVSCGLLLEELLFGGLVRLFFARQRVPSVATEQGRREGRSACAERGPDPAVGGVAGGCALPCAVRPGEGSG